SPELPALLGPTRETGSSRLPFPKSSVPSRQVLSSCAAIREAAGPTRGRARARVLGRARARLALHRVHRMSSASPEEGRSSWREREDGLDPKCRGTSGTRLRARLEHGASEGTLQIEAVCARRAHSS